MLRVILLQRLRTKRPQLRHPTTRRRRTSERRDGGRGSGAEGRRHVRLAEERSLSPIRDPSAASSWRVSVIRVSIRLSPRHDHASSPIAATDSGRGGESPAQPSQPPVLFASAALPDEDGHHSSSFVRACGQMLKCCTASPVNRGLTATAGESIFRLFSFFFLFLFHPAAQAAFCTLQSCI